MWQTSLSRGGSSSWICTVKILQKSTICCCCAFITPPWLFSARLAVPLVSTKAPKRWAERKSWILKRLRVVNSGLTLRWRRRRRFDGPQFETQRRPMSVWVIRRCIVFLSSARDCAGSFMNKSLMKRNRSWTLEDENSLSSKQHKGAALRWRVTAAASMVIRTPSPTNLVY